MSLSQKSHVAPDIANISPLMLAAISALGGDKVWQGRVRGLAGLIRRTFDIQSTGSFRDGRLTFSEQLTFNDGVTNQREWEVYEEADGLHINSESVTLIKPGRLENGALIFDYRLKLGHFSLPYKDCFRVCDSGKVDNTGYVTLWGLRIMTISVTGRSK